jgi:5-methyltetrahydrofolate corrinoid/iron sulfur protein methyltransferase
MRFFIEAAESVTDMPLLKVVRTLPEVLGFPIRTMGGISNLCTGAGDKAKRRLLEQSYVAMLASAGLGFALMDILDAGLVQSARVSGTLAKEDIFSWAMVPGPCEPLLPCMKPALINPNSKKG